MGEGLLFMDPKEGPNSLDPPLGKGPKGGGYPPSPLLGKGRESPGLSWEVGINRAGASPGAVTAVVGEDFRRFTRFKNSMAAHLKVEGNEARCFCSVHQDADITRGTLEKVVNILPQRHAHTCAIAAGSCTRSFFGSACP